MKSGIFKTYLFLSLNLLISMINNANGESHVSFITESIDKPNFEIINKTGLSENRFDLIFIGDRYFEDDMLSYKEDVSRIWSSLSSEHQFWRRYKKFFNVYRIDLISPSFSNDSKDVRNSALGIDLNLDAPFFLFKDQKAVDSILNDLNIKADTRVILMGKNYSSGWGWFNSDLCYANGRKPSIVAHELGHSLVGLRDEYWTWITSTYGVPNMAKTFEEAEDKWGHWYGYTDPETNLSIGKIDKGNWIPHMDAGDDYFRPSPNITLMKRSLNNYYFDAVAREKLIIDLYRHVQPIDSCSNNDLPVSDYDVLEVNVIDNDIIDVTWEIDGITVSDKNYIYIDSLKLKNDCDITLRAVDNTLNHDYEINDRGGWVRKNGSMLSQEVTFQFVKFGKSRKWYDLVPDLFSNWKQSNWFGVFGVYENDWIYHESLKWVYSYQAEKGLWLYIDNIGWHWTNSITYPYIYSHKNSSWIWALQNF
jgi:hypothetical protein